MTLTLEFLKDVAMVIKAEAWARGVTLEAWLQRIATEHVRPARQPRSFAG